MNIDQHIFIRYFLGQASEEEKETIHQWIEHDEANRKRFIRERIRFDASILVDKPNTKVGRYLRIQLGCPKTVVHFYTANFSVFIRLVTRLSVKQTSLHC